MEQLLATVLIALFITVVIGIIVYFVVTHDDDDHKKKPLSPTEKAVRQLEEERMRAAFAKYQAEHSDKH